MKEILFISGKGGTGKTSLTSSFIHLADQCIACDYDVDASNLPILLKPKITSTCYFSAGQTALIDENVCNACGLCAEICRFDAIDTNLQIIPLACEGCAFCEKICPVKAIKMQPRPSGKWYSGVFNRDQTIFFAELKPGEENSGKLVAQVKTVARKMAVADQLPIIIADGPPGIGCAVISALVGVDLAVLVAEPSRSGFHDLQRIYQLLQQRNIKSTLIINKWDLNPVISRDIESWASWHMIPVAGKVPFSTLVANCIAAARVPATDSTIHKMLFPLWENIMKQLTVI
ncbi:CobQ/CobB/MinD/ParA nucleotide binding domain [Syntrophomonas zehnderi OL-4]|uniref:CobQ/CobB/MinD/ParA nucleotide binding domain n=1 Tax=Syntrophomonas zehnderi OL-4 TaxID=690567 RepID=A0A0E4C806_9FIRM|nr:ATP-binding protein [Syntrophomonas zehnderi]CFX17476.1 CobQ/CobB/MinD/ParA nucleotide binding domain [Syntrophomonas zehnderi OL-4]